jgi:hypothetical protein
MNSKSIYLVTVCWAVFKQQALYILVQDKQDIHHRNWSQGVQIIFYFYFTLSLSFMMHHLMPFQKETWNNKPTSHIIIKYLIHTKYVMSWYLKYSKLWIPRTFTVSRWNPIYHVFIYKIIDLDWHIWFAFSTLISFVKHCLVSLLGSVTKKRKNKENEDMDADYILFSWIE